MKVGWQSLETLESLLNLKKVWNSMPSIPSQWHCGGSSGQNEGNFIYLMWDLLLIRHSEIYLHQKCRQYDRLRELLLNYYNTRL